MKALFQFADEAGAERGHTAHQQRQRIRPARSARAGLLRFDEQHRPPSLHRPLLGGVAAVPAMAAAGVEKITARYIGKQRPHLLPLSHAAVSGAQLNPCRLRCMAAYCPKNAASS